jgi:hypothetical protein
MTAINNNVLFRDATAAAAAIVITIVASMSFVQSTAQAPAWRATAAVAMQTAETPKLETVVS